MSPAFNSPSWLKKGLAWQAQMFLTWPYNKWGNSSYCELKTWIPPGQVSLFCFWVAALFSNCLYTGSTLLFQGLCANTTVQRLDLKVSRPAPWAVDRDRPRGLGSWQPLETVCKSSQYPRS